MRAATLRAAAAAAAAALAPSLTVAAPAVREAGSGADRQAAVDGAGNRESVGIPTVNTFQFRVGPVRPAGIR